MAKIPLCPKCKSELTRIFAYDDRYAGESGWGTEGYLTYCATCGIHIVIEKFTRKTYTFEKWQRHIKI